MRPVKEASATLRALAKTLVDNESEMSEQMRESITEAVFRTITEQADTARFFSRPGVVRGMAGLDDMEKRFNERSANAS